MNKRIVLSSMSIFASLALVVGATYAFFSDSGTSNDNVFSSGSLNLKLSDANESVQDNVTASFGGSGLAPGVCLPQQDLLLRNSGTVAADHAEVTAVNTVTDVLPDATPNNMDAYLRFQTFTYDDGTGPVDVTTQFADSNTNGFKDLADFAASLGLDNLGLTNLNGDHTLRVVVCLDASAPNEVQGDSVDSDWTVTLNQNAIQ